MDKDEQMKAYRDALMALRPTILELTDESHKHVGHGGWQEGIITHIHVCIGGPEFESLSRVDRHRKALEALSAWMPDPLHAVRLSIMS